MEKVSILKVNFDPITEKQALDQIERFIAENRFHYIVTPNPEFAVQAQKDKIFREILNNANLSLADGTGILWAAKRKKTPLPQKVPGTDLIQKFMPIAEREGHKIFLLGGKFGVAGLAKKVLQFQYPKIKIVGTLSGPVFNEKDLLHPNDEILEIIKEINSAKPDLLLVAFGAPKQEKFIHYFKDKLDVKVAIGIGGALDYISGITPRAPNWMRRLSLEWLYRLITQPRRLKRILTAIIIFPWLVLTKK